MINRINRERHIIRDIPFASYMRRRLKDDNFFTYQHRDHNGWVLGYWVNKEKGEFVEALLFTNPNDVKQENLRSLFKWYHAKTQGPKELAEQLKSEERADMRKWVDDLRERRSFWNHYRKKSGTQWDDHPAWKPLMGVS